jgi:hypothetical protein
MKAETKVCRMHCKIKHVACFSCKEGEKYSQTNKQTRNKQTNNKNKQQTNNKNKQTTKNKEQTKNKQRTNEQTNNKNKQQTKNKRTNNNKRTNKQQTKNRQQKTNNKQNQTKTTNNKQKQTKTTNKNKEQTNNKQTAHPNNGSEVSHAPEGVSIAVTRLKLASSSDPLKVGCSDVMPFATRISCMICSQSGRMVTSGMSSHHTPSVSESCD